MALKEHLHLHPCRITSVQELKERDNVRRVEYCRWFRDWITASGEDILDVTFFADEARFHLYGCANSQNSHVWSATNPLDIKDTPLHNQKVGVW
jgi:hypothetical protein